VEAPKESHHSFTTSKSRFDNGFEITSLGVVLINDWYIRISTTTLDSICVVMTRKKDGYTKVAFFYDELIAHEFIKDVTGLSS